MPLENLLSHIVLDSPYMSLKSPQETVDLIARWFMLKGHVENSHPHGHGRLLTSVPLHVEAKETPGPLYVASLSHTEFATPLTITVHEHKDVNVVKLHGTPKTEDEKQVSKLQETIKNNVSLYLKNMLKIKQVHKLNRLLEQMEALAFELAEYNSQYSENW